jgi:hypothetical protein
LQNIFTEGGLIMVTEIRVRIILNTKHEEEAIECMRYNRSYNLIYSDDKITIFELIDKDRGRSKNGK